MPDGTIDIYIESSFFTAASGVEDVYAAFWAGQLENIGQRETVVDYILTPEISGSVSRDVEYFATWSGAVQHDGYVSTLHKYEAEPTESGVLVSLVDYSVPLTTSGLARTEEVELEYFTGITKISGSVGFKMNFIPGILYDYSDNILATYWIFGDEVIAYDYEADYTAGGHYDPLIPGPPEDQVITSGTDDFRHYFTMGDDTSSGVQAQDCELFLAGYPMEFHPSKYTYRFHLAAGLEGDKQAAEWEATSISGAVIDVPLDVASTATASGYYNFDGVCGHTSFSGIDFPVDLVAYSVESEVVSGTIGYYFHDEVSGVSGTEGYTFDVNLFSLKISNFSLDIDEYSFASGTICVDLTDDVHNVSTSDSYFIIGETETSGNTYTPITDGYTMCFDSPNDFADLTGATTVTVHTENDNGDILERDFYLTSGYIVEYDNRTQNYDWNSQVVVRGSAENMASCPNTGVDAYFFTTPPKYGIDLGASIVGRPWSEKNLTAEITPTTDTIYFYGKVFRIEVRAKDFAGNVMEPFTFEFRIEDKPE